MLLLPFILYEENTKTTLTEVNMQSFHFYHFIPYKFKRKWYKNSVSLSSTQNFFIAAWQIPPSLFVSLSSDNIAFPIYLKWD